MAPVQFAMQALANTVQAVSSLDLLTNSYYRMTTATNQGVLRFRVAEGALRNLTEILTVMPVVLSGLDRSLTGMADRVVEDVKSYGEYERKLFEVKYQGVTTEKELHFLQDRIESLAAASNFSKIQLADLARALKSSGLNAEATSAMMEPIMQLSTIAPQIGLEIGAKLGRVMWTKFGEQIPDPRKLLEMAYAMTRTAAMEPEDLLSFIDALGSTQLIAHDQIPTLFAMGAALKNSGNSARLAGQNVRAFVQSLLSLERSAAQSEISGNRSALRLKQVAREMLDVHTFSKGKFNELTDILRGTTEAMGKMSEEKAAVLGLTALNYKGLNVLETFKNMKIDTADVAGVTGDMTHRILEGADALDFMKGVLSKDTDVLGRASKEANNLTSQVGIQLTNAIKNLDIAIGGLFTNTLTPFYKIEISILEGLDKLATNGGAFGKALAGGATFAYKAFDLLIGVLNKLTAILFPVLGMLALARFLAGGVGAAAGGIAAGGSAWGMPLGGALAGGAAQAAGGLGLRALLGPLIGVLTPFLPWIGLIAGGALLVGGIAAAVSASSDSQSQAAADREAAYRALAANGGGAGSSASQFMLAPKVSVKNNINAELDGNQVFKFTEERYRKEDEYEKMRSALSK